MLNIIDWLLNLFNNDAAARAFVLAPDQSLRDAGLSGVSPAQLTAVASTAMPELMLASASDPVGGLQRAVANHYGYNDYTPYSSNYAPGYEYSPNVASPSLLSPSWAPQNTFAPQTDLASHNQTDLASHNQTPIMSPNQGGAGANAQQGGFNLGFGDITLGDKTSNTASGNGVVVGGENDGDIVSGDGAVLGNNNDVSNGDTIAGAGASVAQGHGVVHTTGNTTSTGSGSVIRDNDAPVFQDVDASGGNGGGAAGGHGGGLLGVGIGNSSSGGNAGGGGITVVSKDTGNTTSSSTHTVSETTTSSVIDDNSSSGNTVIDHSLNPTHTSTVTSTTTEHTLVDNSGNHSLLGNSGGSNSLFGGDQSLFGNTGGSQSLFGGDQSVAGGDHAAVGAPAEHHSPFGF